MKQNRLRLISESIQIVNEGHVDTDAMMYADGISKALQLKKTELGNMWTAEIVESSSDYVTGNGGGRIKYTKPAVPDEVTFSVEIENRKSPEPQLDEFGQPIPDSGDNVAEEMGDVKVTVSINGNQECEETFKDQALAGLKEIVTGFVMNCVDQYHQKVSVNEHKAVYEEKLIKGEQLSSDQKKMVLAAFVMRNTKENEANSKKSNPTAKITQTDEEWIKDHAFWFKDDGKTLSGRKKHAEPAYLAD